MSVEDLLKQSFRLNAYEARTYLTLLKQEMGPKELSRAARVPQPRIYDTLRSLQEKGFIEQAGERYVAVAPRTALKGRVLQFKSLFEEEQKRREKAIENLLSLLEPLHSKRAAAPGDVVLLKGIQSIGNRLMEIINESKDIFFLIRKAVKAKELFKAYLEGAEICRKRIRVLIPKGVVLDPADEAFVSKLNIRVRYYDTPLVDLMVADERDVMIGVPDPLSDEPFRAIAIWVRNVSFGKSIRESLEDLWNKSSELKAPTHLEAI